MNLASFQRPSRYINGELNAIHKKAPVRVALAFPDVYEVGMSHLGLKILYSIVNNLPYASAERVFSPWTDLDDAMRRKGILLSSLESSLPLKDFDIVGFSLQYELSYTTVLNMLSLGGIPLRSEERLHRKDSPLIIAGGPCTLNPHPMSAFIDVFLIGDGEEAIIEILRTYHTWKKEGTADRTPLLKTLAGIEGVFVPSLGEGSEIHRRIVSSLENAPFPDSPVLPFTSIIHDRVNIEIARGCSMGCRFCQAGMACRPVRERSPERILELAERSLKNTGYEDVSFTSLSSGDYSCLPQLMKEFNRRFSGQRISMSLPSLRVASVNSSMLREIRTVRKTGFTIAPEAGTERLRAVINKDFSQETYLAALETLFREGWQNLKLYFMTGLPTETDEDIEAIPEMVLQAIKTSKRLTGRNVNISVGVSSFVPKPHTPFQWFGQNEITLLKEKNSFLKKALLRRGVKFKGHDEQMALLEAVFARGDKTLAPLIEAAWAAGCRLDAWTEVFDFEKWKRAMEVTKKDAFSFAGRDYGEHSQLPWDNIKTGVSREYLWGEYLRAIKGKFTQDCRRQCHGCGLACPEKEGHLSIPQGDRDVAVAIPGPRRTLPPDVAFRVRLQYSKTGAARYLSHLELTTAIMRAMRRAGFPLKYSEGFHPLPKISFGPALGVGVAGLREYLDLELIPPFDIETGLLALNATLPGGIRADQIITLYGREKSLNSFIVRYIYEIRHAGQAAIEGFMEKKELLVPRKNDPVNIREMVEDIITADDRTFRITVRDQGEKKVRLDELLPEILGGPTEESEITRIAMFGWDGEWTEPVKGEKAWAARS